MHKYVPCPLRARISIPCNAQWNYFENDINESLVHRIADELVATGLVSAGYRYLNLDAGVWLPNRTSDGRCVCVCVVMQILVEFEFRDFSRGGDTRFRG